jgi:hypothetical protein
VTDEREKGFFRWAFRGGWLVSIERVLDRVRRDLASEDDDVPRGRGARRHPAAKRAGQRKRP